MLPYPPGTPAVAAGLLAFAGVYWTVVVLAERRHAARRRLVAVEGRE